tara:strand:- start:175 stop:468 length:294 start_codon:yes stop_codon:yes gene_type:complete
MTQPNFRALCAELVTAFKDENTYTHRVEALDRARTALATPPPEPPTREDLIQLAYEYFDFRGNSHRGLFFATSIEAKADPYQSLTSFVYAVLERWGK